MAGDYLGSKASKVYIVLSYSVDVHLGTSDVLSMPVLVTAQRHESPDKIILSRSFTEAWLRRS